MSASLVDFLHAFVPSPQPNSREITSEWEGMILLLTIKGHFQAEHNILSPDRYIKYYDMIKNLKNKKNVVILYQGGSSGEKILSM